MLFITFLSILITYLVRNLFLTLNYELMKIINMLVEIFLKLLMIIFFLHFDGFNLIIYEL